MDQLLDKIRSYDFNLYVSMYQYGVKNPETGYLFFLMSKYGILIPFSAFIYLIYTKKINALICSFFAMGLAGLVDFLIFIFWKRPRPYITHASVIDLEAANFRVDIASFPSSHTYIAFAVAASVFLYGHKKLGSALFIVSILIALSRIGTGLHYPSDVIGGALLGIATGIVAYILVHRAEKYWK